MSQVNTANETKADTVLEVHAVYENGVFRVLEPDQLNIHDGQRVWLTIEKPISPEEMSALAASVYEGLSQEEIADIEEVALDRSNFFGEREQA